VIYVHESLMPDMVDAALVKPHHENANNGDVDAIVESMDRVGIYRPIIVSRRSGRILAGHHVYEAMLREGFEQVPVKYVDVDEDKERVILLGDNGIARRAWLDPALEIDLLKRVMEAGDDVSESLLGTGYDAQMVAALVQAHSTPFHPSGSSVNSRDVTCPACGERFTLEVDL
jgi:ParB-like chromosome segregation protein Spo0J